MTNQRLFSLIRATVHSILPDAKILIFGSRARGDQNSHSDVDLLITTKRELTDKEKINWSSTLSKALVRSIKTPVDVLFDTEEEVNIKKTLPGHVIRTALREGFAI